MTLSNYEKKKRAGDTPADIPPGTYRVEMLSTTNQGADLLLTSRILKGKYKGRHFHTRWESSA